MDASPGLGERGAAAAFGGAAISFGAECEPRLSPNFRADLHQAFRDRQAEAEAHLADWIGRLQQLGAELQKSLHEEMCGQELLLTQALVALEGNKQQHIEDVVDRFVFSEVDDDVTDFEEGDLIRVETLQGTEGLEDDHPYLLPLQTGLSDQRLLLPGLSAGAAPEPPPPPGVVQVDRSPEPTDAPPTMSSGLSDNQDYELTCCLGVVPGQVNTPGSAKCDGSSKRGATPESHVLSLPSEFEKPNTSVWIREFAAERNSCASLVDRITTQKNRLQSDPYWRRLRKVLNSTPYQVFCSSIIIMNVIFVGFSTEMSVQRRFATLRGRHVDDLPKTTKAIDLSFCFWFTFELLLNLLSDPWAFFQGEAWRWNAFDSCLVANCLVEIVVEVPNIGVYLRTLRVFRTARVLRIVRVFRIFSPLRLMVQSIAQSFVSLLWVFVLMVMLMYIFALFFMSAAESYAESIGFLSTTVEDLESMYGSLFASLLSLFMAVSGGADWKDLADPLAEVDEGYRTVFIIYLFFVVFGVLNVVTGAFVDSFAVVSQRDRDVVIQDELLREEQYVRDIMHIFQGADKDLSGSLSLEEFETHLKDSRVKAFFHTLELDVSHARALFMLLDTDGTNEVGIDEFVIGCTRLKGTAKSIDVNMLLFQTESFMCQVDRLEKFLLSCDQVGVDDLYKDDPIRRVSSALRPYYRDS